MAGLAGLLVFKRPTSQKSKPSSHQMMQQHGRDITTNLLDQSEGRIRWLSHQAATKMAANLLFYPTYIMLLTIDIKNTALTLKYMSTCTVFSDTVSLWLKMFLWSLSAEAFL